MYFPSSPVMSQYFFNGFADGSAAIRACVGEVGVHGRMGGCIQEVIMYVQEI